jgi:hypothetical protein
MTATMIKYTRNSFLVALVGWITAAATSTVAVLLLPHRRRNRYG